MNQRGEKTEEFASENECQLVWLSPPGETVQRRLGDLQSPRGIFRRWVEGKRWWHTHTHTVIHKHTHIITALHRPSLAHRHTRTHAHRQSHIHTFILTHILTHTYSTHTHTHTHTALHRPILAHTHRERETFGTQGAKGERKPLQAELAWTTSMSDSSLDEWMGGMSL